MDRSGNPEQRQRRHVGPDQDGLLPPCSATEPLLALLVVVDVSVVEWLDPIALAVALAGLSAGGAHERVVRSALPDERGRPLPPPRSVLEGAVARQARAAPGVAAAVAQRVVLPSRHQFSGTPRRMPVRAAHHDGAALVLTCALPPHLAL